MKFRRTFITAIIAVAAVTAVATGSASPVVGMPSFDKIAYTNFDARDNGFDVMLARTDGSDVTNITHDGTAKKNVDPNWSANGMKVAYTSYYANGGADIIVVDANGKGAVNLTGPSVRPGILNIHPTWSPDGSIVFASNRDGNFDLYRVGVAATDRSRPVQMTFTMGSVQNYDPDYSADGKMLAFAKVSLSITGGSSASILTMMSIPGAPATKVTQSFTGLGDRGPAWSPSGKQIAFYSDRAGSSDLYFVNRDGTALRQLTTNKAADSAPSWSPDGDTLVFLSDRTTHTELWMTSLVGLSPGPPVAWQVTFDKQQKGAPDWQPTSASDRDLVN
jgi:Tol biopolymer transport system component